MRKKREEIGFVVATALFEVGDALNLTHISTKSINIEKKFIEDDFDAIQSDWSSVGKEVKIGLEKYGRTHPARNDKQQVTIGSY